MHTIHRFFVLIVLAAASTHATASVVNLSPDTWPKAEREHAEQVESQTSTPLESQNITGAKGLVSATVSPIAVYAGLQALKQGGTAADAAATTALTQITTQLGSVVSYAGVFTMLYYEAKTQKVYSMDAGFNSYLNETDPLTIPTGDLGTLPFGAPPTAAGAKGRETLVPGFMAGLEAMHGRFGRLPFKELFAPAIWYDEHGITLSPMLGGFFQFRKAALARTPEGRRFMAQSGGEIPLAGERFVQRELAETLKAVARDGARAMYTGRWAEDVVALVQREGGKVTPEDLKRYAPIWSEPHQQTFFGRTVYVNGAPHHGAYQLLAGLNLVEARQLDRKGPYWTDRETFLDLTRISQFVASAPAINPYSAERLHQQGVDVSPAAQLGKDYAKAIAPQLEQLFGVVPDQSPKHSNAIVVIDQEGNIAVITHTINTVVWGDTGLVVGGIPLPNSASFQQQLLAAIKPGDRVIHQIVDTIVLEGKQPVLATASIGASLVPETLRVLLGVLGQKQDLATVMAAPPLLMSFTPPALGQTPAQQPASVPEKGYAPEFMNRLKSALPNLNPVPQAMVGPLRGTLAAVAIDPKTGQRTAVNQPDVMVFNGAE